MKKFIFNKLVRDGVIANMLAGSDQKPNYHTLSEPEFIIELKKKLLEEATELVNAKTEELLGELADIEEIINYLLSSLGSTRADLEAKVESKRAKVGGFEKKAYVNFNEISEDSEWVEIYRQQPTKYIEVAE